MTRRALILAGGGYKVAFQAGVLQVWLDEAGLEFDHADGASGGNLNLAMWCQGMSGTRIADNWRHLPPRVGIGFNWREWWKGPFAASLLTLDAFRRNVLTRWGLDWRLIRDTKREATFNIYDFTTHQLLPMPAAEMDEDLLIASISLPMWFPPVRRRGHTYLDAVFLSDANLEEAIERGADELWVIWTVSERSEWQAGFMGIYFGIIETVANGNFRHIVQRVRHNNAEVAAGRAGEFGRHIELRILRAEVPVHYLMVVGADRVRHCVERGVAAGRRWCQEQGIPLDAAAPPVGEDRASARPTDEDHTKLRFTEEMKGFVTLGEDDFQRGHDMGKAAGTPLMVHLTITLDGVRRFVVEPQHLGQAEGWVHCEALGGRLPVERGTFNLFVDQGDPTQKWMHYRLMVRSPDGEPLTVSGHKVVRDDPGFDVWDDTSTLYTRVYRGHVEPGDEKGFGANAAGKNRVAGEAAETIVAAGIIRVLLLDFLHQLTTFEVEGADTMERAAVMAQFGQFFSGRLWDVYARRILSSAPF
ncbi:MAG: patatin-like phospholipase family protein [Chloroflexota bacterium]|nr:patatin-like phospholipase family protein [Chloroflexota bacterium]